MLEARPIIYKNGQLQVLDQLQLPSKMHYDYITSVEEGWNSIKSMKVRGAPAISIVAGLSLAVELQNKSFNTKDELNNFIVKQFKYLETSRPTAINLKQVSESAINMTSKFVQKENISVEQMKESIICAMNKLLESDVAINKAIGKFGGLEFVEKYGSNLSILTHCNTGSLATAGYGTALGVIRYLHENNHLKHVYCTETRPYNQGARLTAFELVNEEIPATLICDSMVASLMKSGKISAVAVGADRVVANGDTANKIGTYQIAVCAKYHNIPFFVASPRSTLDFSLENGDDVLIEERPHSEMTSINSIPIAAEGIGCWNPAFDVTPAELITGIITEYGVFSPNMLKDQDNLKSSSLFD